jgi:hypothetical protein
MSLGTEARTGVAALRPWPFGPPLRGRALRSDAGPQAVSRQAAAPVGRACRTTAPVGGLSCGHLLCCAM